MDDDRKDTQDESWNLRDCRGATGVQGTGIQGQHWTVVVDQFVGRGAATGVEITEHCHLKEIPDR